MSEQRWLVPSRNQTSDFDVLMNALGAFIVLFALAIAISSQHKSEKKADGYVEGVYRVIAIWPGELDDDVDLYMQDPTGQIGYFKSREVGLMHLERDDYGHKTDEVMTSSGVVTLYKNEEHFIVRGTIPGEYIVNVHMYSQRSTSGPVPVTVTLLRSDGSAIVVTRQIKLKYTGDEITAFRFTVNEFGVVTATNELEKSFVGIVTPQSSIFPY